MSGLETNNVVSTSRNYCQVQPSKQIVFVSYINLFIFLELKLASVIFSIVNDNCLTWQLPEPNASNNAQTKIMIKNRASGNRSEYNSRYYNLTINDKMMTESENLHNFQVQVSRTSALRFWAMVCDVIHFMQHVDFVFFHSFLDIGFDGSI